MATISIVEAEPQDLGELQIDQGDTRTLAFDLGVDCTNWVVQFGGWLNNGATAFALPVRACTWTNQVKGTGTIAINTTDTKNPVTFFCKLAITNGYQTLTQFYVSLVIRGTPIFPEIAPIQPQSGMTDGFGTTTTDGFGTTTTDGFGN